MSQDFYIILSRLTKTCKDTDIEITLEKNIKECLEIRGLVFNNVCESPILASISLKVSDEDSIQWRFISVLSHTLLWVADSIKVDVNSLTSINLQKSVKSALEFIVAIGLLPTLIPGIGLPIEKRCGFSQHYKKEEISITAKYNRLKSICNLLTKLCDVLDMKTIIYTNFLKDYLAALFQLSWAPIMKPNNSKAANETDFVMTHEFWVELQNDQKEYRLVLGEVMTKCFRPMIIKELLILQGVKDPPPPIFMKKILSKELSNILVSQNGLLCVIRCFFDCFNIDVGNQWKQIDLIKRLIAVKHGSTSDEDYLRNICQQMKDIIKIPESNDYIIIIAACVENLLAQNSNNKFILEVIDSIVDPLICNNNGIYINGTLLLSSGEVYKAVKNIDVSFNHLETCLPTKFLTPVIYNIFGLRVFSGALPMKVDLDNILMKYFSFKHPRDDLFDSLIFKKSCEHINNDIVFDADKEGVQIKFISDGGNVSVEAAVNCMLNIIKEHPDKSDLSHAFYIYCLKTLMKLSESCKNENLKDFLILEDDVHDLISKNSESMMVLLRALEELTTMSFVLNSLKEDPKLVIDFINSFLNEYVDSLNNGTDFNNEECVIICLTLLTVLLSQDTSTRTFKKSLKHIEPLIITMIDKSARENVIYLSEEIKRLLLDEQRNNESKTQSKFEQAISSVCDLSIPDKAHGLMSLTRLIDENDVETISKKHYVQCIFEENLRHEDSYIYLSAINGLAALAKFSADDILEVLTREFCKENKQFKGTAEESDNNMVRMKIGEVLVKVTKNLGDMASNHKALMLNTFLVGCKDSDDLLRASSLSNLAEVSKVLSYKLGPVLYEMLNCIQSILETDKSPQCRRASVLVVSSLLSGLGRESLNYLKEALLPIYRTLKRLYKNEAEDPVVRLHAQIGLEELNNSTRDILFGPIKMEKKIFILDKPQ